MEHEAKMIITNANERRSDDQHEFRERRHFLRCLGKWSIAVIGGVTFDTAIEPTQVFGWVDTRGNWVNGPAVGGSTNRGASGMNRDGGSWVDRRD